MEEENTTTVDNGQEATTDSAEATQAPAEGQEAAAEAGTAPEGDEQPAETASAE